MSGHCVDLERRIAELETALARCTAGLQIACANLSPSSCGDLAGRLYEMRIDAERVLAWKGVKEGRRDGNLGSRL